MDWTDDGIVLSAKKHGETSAIVTLLTPGHGRHLGLVRGGGKRAGGLLQPGNLLKARWQARLSEHLGTFRCELTEAFAAPVLRDRLKLAGLSAACAMAEGAFRIYDDWSLWGRYAFSPHLRSDKGVYWQNTHDALFGVMWRRRLTR